MPFHLDLIVSLSCPILACLNQFKAAVTCNPPALDHINHQRPRPILHSSTLTQQEQNRLSCSSSVFLNGFQEVVLFILPAEKPEKVSETDGDVNIVVPDPLLGSGLIMGTA